MILEAAKYSKISNNREDKRNFVLGAIGIRKDGAIVKARNGSVNIGCSYGGGWSFPAAHAERKLCSKMDYNGTVYVSRIARSTGELAMARPCVDCMIALRSRKVSKCYYSINPYQYGMIDFENGEYERVFNTHPKKVKK